MLLQCTLHGLPKQHFGQGLKSSFDVSTSPVGAAKPRQGTPGVQGIHGINEGGDQFGVEFSAVRRREFVPRVGDHDPVAPRSETSEKHQLQGVEVEIVVPRPEFEQGDRQISEEPVDLSHGQV